MSDQSQPPNGVPPDVAAKYDEELVHPPQPSDAGPVDTAELKAGAQERSKQRPLLQKILAVFQKEKGSYRELIINSEPLEKRVALLVDGRLEKFEIERESDSRMVGGIYKGKIKNLDPGLKAAFVDIGYTKNAFLHYWDMLPAAADSSVEVVRVNKKKNAPPRPVDPTVKDIPSMYPPGSEIVIQVTKGPIGTKGPRTTTNLSIPGRYLILTPFSDGCGISRKIEDLAERKRLKTLINELTIPEGVGVIVRTAGEGKKARYFVRDLHLLLKTWEDIQAKMKNDRAPACLYQFPTDIYLTTQMMLVILKSGGLTTGGLNFDAKVRRESFEPVDLFHAHIGGMDAFARGLKIAAAIIEDGRLDAFKKVRYSTFDNGIGAKIESRTTSFEELEAYTLENGEPLIGSGRQEMLENLINDFI